MFTELKQLIEKRPLTITVASVSEGRIRVNVVPQALPKDAEVNTKIKFSHKGEVAEIPESALKALTTPLSITGTPEEIDTELPRALSAYSETHRGLQQTLDQAKTQISEAMRAIEEREKAKAKSKAHAGNKGEDKDSKPAGKKDETVGLLPLWCAPPSNTPPQAAQASVELANAADSTSQPITQEVVAPCQ